MLRNKAKIIQAMNLLEYKPLSFEASFTTSNLRSFMYDFPNMPRPKASKIQLKKSSELNLILCLYRWFTGSSKRAATLLLAARCWQCEEQYLFDTFWGRNLVPQKSQGICTSSCFMLQNRELGSSVLWRAYQKSDRQTHIRWSACSRSMHKVQL